MDADLMSRLDDLFGRYPEYLSIEQLCEVLDIGRVTAYKWLKDGTIPAYQLRGRWKILRDDVKDVVAQGSNLPHQRRTDRPDVDGA